MERKGHLCIIQNLFAMKFPASPKISIFVLFRNENDSFTAYGYKSDFESSFLINCRTAENFHLLPPFPQSKNQARNSL